MISEQNVDSPVFDAVQQPGAPGFQDETELYPEVLSTPTPVDPLQLAGLITKQIDLFRATVLELGKLPFETLTQAMAPPQINTYRESRSFEDFIGEGIVEKELSRRMMTARPIEVAPNLAKLKEDSKRKAIELRTRLGLDEGASIDGFDKIHGLIKKYANKEEDSVEFLRRARENEC